MSSLEILMEVQFNKPAEAQAVHETLYSLIHDPLATSYEPQISVFDSLGVKNSKKLFNKKFSECSLSFCEVIDKTTFQLRMEGGSDLDDVAEAFMKAFKKIDTALVIAVGLDFRAGEPFIFYFKGNKFKDYCCESGGEADEEVQSAEDMEELLRIAKELHAEDRLKLDPYFFD